MVANFLQKNQIFENHLVTLSPRSELFPANVASSIRHTHIELLCPTNRAVKANISRYPQFINISCCTTLCRGFNALPSLSFGGADMDIELLKPHVEALIFASDCALPVQEICKVLSASLEQEFDEEQIQKCITAIKFKYDNTQFPFHLEETGGGYQFLTKKAYHKTVLNLHGDKHIKKLSAAAMETLSIIAYRQPVTKGEIEYIRGVSADYSIQKLLEKELIVITGRSEELVGKPLLYATSKSFMDYLGINSASQLPQLKEITDKETILPTDALEAAPFHPTVKLLNEQEELRQAS
jgi:segregation and condensation protein B